MFGNVITAVSEKVTSEIPNKFGTESAMKYIIASTTATIIPVFKYSLLRSPEEEAYLIPVTIISATIRITKINRPILKAFVSGASTLASKPVEPVDIEAKTGDTNKSKRKTKKIRLLNIKVTSYVESFNYNPLLLLLMKIFQVVILILGVIVGTFILLCSFEVITYSSTPSIGYGFYYTTFNQNINIGDLVKFDNPDLKMLSTKKLIKKVIQKSGSQLYVKGKTTDELYEETGVKNLYSYDSDFFGWIDIEKNNVKRVKPLILLNKVFFFLNK